MFSGYNNDMDVENSFRPPAMEGCFTEMYRCQSASALPSSNPLRHTLDYCGKIILPQSALEQLSNYNIEYPMVFKLTNDRTGASSHCGVLEFSAKEGISYIPGWLMETLSLRSGDFVQISNARLMSGKMIKIQPQSPDFLDITDPRAVLEFTLRQFTTLSPNDCFWINYADRIFKVKVLETEPDLNGILVIETDLNVDFAPPVGYVEPTHTPKFTKSIANTLGLGSSVIKDSPSTSFVPFSGAGRSLRGSSSGIKSPAPTPTNSIKNCNSNNGLSPVDPDRPITLQLPRNTMFFGVSSTATTKKENPEIDDKATVTSSSQPDVFKPFQGKGRSLR